MISMPSEDDEEAVVVVEHEEKDEELDADDVESALDRFDPDATVEMEGAGVGMGGATLRAAGVRTRAGVGDL